MRNWFRVIVEDDRGGFPEWVNLNQITHIHETEDERYLTAYLPSGEKLWIREDFLEGEALIKALKNEMSIAA